MKATVQPLDLTAPVNSGTATLVEAGAGTGKTYNLARLYVKLLLEQGLEVRQVLTVTFTNAATEELSVRIRELLRHVAALFGGAPAADDFDSYLLTAFKGKEMAVSDRLRKALAGIDEAAIYTIHAFCQRTLQQAAFESGTLFSLEPIADESELILDTARDFWRTHLYRAPAGVVSIVRASGISPESLAALFGLFRRDPDTVIQPAAPAFDDACSTLERNRQNMSREFGGMLAEVRRLIEDDKGLAKNAKTYNPAQLDRIFSDLATFLDDGRLQSVDSLRILTPAALAVNRKPKAIEKGIEPPEHPLFKACAVMVPVVEQVTAAFRHSFLSGAEAALKRKMTAGRHMSYHDMLVDLYSALIAPGSGRQFVKVLQDKYQAALIDEFQDTDPVQYGIFGTVFAGKTVYYIGDPKQAIYRFRGADINTYLQAAGAAEHARSLDTNWRSSPVLVQAVNYLFGRIPGILAEQGIGYNKVEAGLDAGVRMTGPADEECGAALQFMYLPWEGSGRNKYIRPKGAVDRDLLPFIAEEIKRLCGGGYAVRGKVVTPGDIAILTRTGKQGLAVQRELRRHRVNSVLLTDSTVFETREMAELLQLLSAVASPRDERLIRGVLLGSLWGMAPEELEQVQADATGWAGIMAAFDGWHRLWEQSGVMEVVARFMSARNVAARLLACTDGERRYANLLQSAEVLNNAAAEGKRAAGELLQWVRKCMDAPDTDMDYLQLRLESDADAVKVVTVHRSKGLEFPVVFCPDLWRSMVVKKTPFVYHGEHKVHLVAGDYDGADAAMIAADRERLAEDLRLVYVALTRAKYRCYLADGPMGGEYGISALAWLLHRADAAGDDPVAWLAGAKERSITSKALLKDLQGICDGRDDVGIRMVERTPVTPPLGAGAVDAAQQAVAECVGDPVRLRAWRISSFSGLTAGQHQWQQGKEQVRGIDYEAGIGQAPADDVPATGIFAFPKGAGPGSALHAVFENIDFSDGDQEKLKTVVHQCLSQYGIHESFEDAAVKNVTSIILSDLPCDEGNSLKDIGPDACLKELEFVYPLNQLGPDALNGALDRIYPGTGGSEGADWARLDFNPLHGYIRGFIDLIACWNGKYYILDWKSNHLGNRPEDYGRAQMQAAMHQHHYTLQYLLYTVALDRFLAGRINGYSYETHFGGVYYVFLRGVAGTGDTGWYYDRPGLDVITELQELLLPEGGA